MTRVTPVDPRSEQGRAAAERLTAVLAEIKAENATRPRREERAA